MKILTPEQIRACDSATIENEPILSIDLMERASNQLVSWLLKEFDAETKFVLFAGSGNNGGDALAVARLLINSGYKNITVFYLKIAAQPSSDCAINLQRLQKQIQVVEIAQGEALPQIEQESIVVDGIFGSGLNRPITGYWANLVNHINNSNSCVISIDVPSGLFAWDNSNNNGPIIKATHTLTLEMPKLPFFFAENEQFVGQWHVLPIGLDKTFIDAQESKFYFQDINLVTEKQPRKRFSHKGTYGHALLVAGSRCMMGASVLASKSCLRSGVGLLTTHVPQSEYQIMQIAVPEAIVNVDATEKEFCKTENLQRFSAIGIGPGLGKSAEMYNVVEQILCNAKVPLVIDADALNIIAERKALLDKLPHNTIITPHPGEFDRLTRKHQSGYERFVTQIELAKKQQIIVVLKGAYTSIALPDGRVFFNSTGNPGMATAGSGDVLTGIVLGLLAQGYKPEMAARLGVFVHGLAGDFAAEKVGYQALVATDIINNLGCAFQTC